MPIKKDSPGPEAPLPDRVEYNFISAPKRAPPRYGSLIIFDHFCTVKGCWHGIYRPAGRPPLPRGPCSVHRQAHALVGQVLKEHGEEIAEALANDDALWEGLDKIRAGTHLKCATEGCVSLIEIVKRCGRPRKYCEVCRP